MGFLKKQATLCVNGSYQLLIFIIKAYGCLVCYRRLKTQPKGTLKKPIKIRRFNFFGLVYLPESINQTDYVTLTRIITQFLV